MVKLGFYCISKAGKRGLGEYEEVCLRVPKEFHELVRCLQNRQLEIKAAREGNVIHIWLIDKQA